MTPKIKQPKTNEDLIAIVKGLDVKPEDFILAIGGSGDQALALSEYARKVIAVDIDKSQVKHMSRLVKLLERGDYNRFLNERSVSANMLRIPNEVSKLLGVGMGDGRFYFNPTNLKRIRKRLEVLEIREESILDTIKKEYGFNKIYLSNALGMDKIPGENHNMENIIKYDDIPKVLQLIKEKLPEDGLVYVSNGETIVDFLDGHELQLDRYLTQFAKDPRWIPIVFRKVNNQTNYSKR